jgi:hypothetical protein
MLRQTLLRVERGRQKAESRGARLTIKGRANQHAVQRGKALPLCVMKGPVVLASQFVQGVREVYIKRISCLLTLSESL